VGLPLAYRRDDLDHHNRISLVDVVMGGHSSPATSGASRRALGNRSRNQLDASPLT
jgi:hypothetical protein